MTQKQPLLKGIDILGKILLAWFVFETFRYYYTGRFTEEIRMIPNIFNQGLDLLAIYNVIQIPVASIGVFILIPLIVNGHILGLMTAILYWIMGYVTNPLWFVIPRNLQITTDGKATSLLLGINYFWSGFTLLLLITFYFSRRRLQKNDSTGENNGVAS